MYIKIHRGTAQIGGCITEISSSTTRILIDFGEELPGSVSKREIDAAGILKGVDALFFTHYHSDHAGMLDKVPATMPIYIGPAAKDIMLILNKHLAGTFPEKSGLIPAVEGFCTYKPAQRITIGDISVTPFFTDHSAYDAYMLLVECGGKRVLHTGDFRTHGMKGKKVLPMLKKYVGRVDTLICEGTMLSRGSSYTPAEYDLRLKMEELPQKNVFLLCSSTNFDRIANFYHSRKKRPFVCDEYQKKELKAVSDHAKGKTSFYNFNKVYPYQSNNQKLHNWIMGSGIFALIRCNDFSKKTA